MSQSDGGWRPLHVRAREGLKLFARDYGDRAWPETPLFCLAGLTRNSADFHELALAFSGDPRNPRRVVCLDARGRGRSDHDRDWRNYTPTVELADALDVMVAAGLERAVLIGSSRGGIVAMMMAAARPGVLAGVVLNDIGPEIAAAGLARIKGYVGRMPTPKDWREAADLIRSMNEKQFPNLTAEDWMNQARKTFFERDGRLQADYDPALARLMAGIDLGEQIPTLWPQFDALRNIPTLVLRGENSDILLAETVERMAAGHPRLQTLEIAGQGHAPFLSDAPTIQRIGGFVNRISRHRA